jgi:5'-nucleotidase
VTGAELNDPARPRVIVTNDDGIDSAGLWQLAAAAAAAGLDVLVAAPDSEASGSGTAMSAVQDGGRVKVERRELPGAAAAIPAYAVRATPAFIAFLAARGAFGFRPRFVLSGINRGPNTGRAVLHSGTVGAALTAASHGITAAAFSLNSHEADGKLEWATAARVAGQVIAVLPELSSPDQVSALVLNVNVPNVPPGRLVGIRRASLAPAGAVQAAVVGPDEGYVQIHMPGRRAEPEPGTDSAVLAAGYASVTALQGGVCEASPDALPWPPPVTAGIRQPG